MEKYIDLKRKIIRMWALKKTKAIPVELKN